MNIKIFCIVGKRILLVSDLYFDFIRLNKKGNHLGCHHVNQLFDYLRLYTFFVVTVLVV